MARGRNNYNRKPAKKRPAGKKYTNKPTYKKARPRPKKKQDDCFITTACVEYYNLPDDCMQLSTLRMFRDTYLRQTDNGRKLVEAYYKVAPKLVAKLKTDPEKEALFTSIFNNINVACHLIKNNDYPKAQDIYTEVVLSLQKRFS